MFFKVLFFLFALIAFFPYFAYGLPQEIKARINVYDPQSVYVKWAVPEGRVGPDETNWDTLYFLTIKSTTDNSIVFTMPTLASTDIQGKDLNPINLTGVSNGVYDFYIKGHQSLTLKMSNIPLTGGLHRLNFSQSDNSESLGPLRLLAGDISGSTSSPVTMGDDVINSVDLSILLNHLDEDDPTHRDLRANLNQDPVVNSVDMSLMLNNLDKEGDK